MKKIYINNEYPHILHGADYYPEQWTDCPEILEKDTELMKLANCNEMTLGVFAWSSLEPSEGEFDFSFLDDAMERLNKAGSKIVLATPSAARPAWLSRKYPETMRVNEQFVSLHRGMRANHCYTSPLYREKVKKIDGMLAKRYDGFPALIAWHISNEFGGECYCPKCRKAFREWLKEKYVTIDNLNREWWTKFWSHSYSDWYEIEPPSRLGETSINGLTLDWKRFVTYQTTDFMNSEIEAVREYSKNTPITTNLMGMYYGLDYRQLTKKIDFISNDHYPEWKDDANEDLQTAKYSSMVHDMCRTLKHKPFMIMECAPSLVNWRTYNKLQRPHILELSSLQAIAHGADTIQYFQWRKSRGGAEKFHGAVVDHSGNSTARVFSEVRQLGKVLKDIDEISGTVTNAKAAIIYEWPNQWAVDNAQGFCNCDKKLPDTLMQYYSPFWERGIDVDIIGTEDCLENYTVVVAPMLYMIDAAFEEKIEKYVKNGGVLLSTFMTGLVNENDLCHLGGFPCGTLKNVFGIISEETDTLYPEDKNQVIDSDGNTFTAKDYCECIHLAGADALAYYNSDFYKGTPAVTLNLYGGGKAYYIAFRDNGDFVRRMVSEIIANENIFSGFDGELPEGVTAHTRLDGIASYVFLQNFNGTPKKIYTSKSWENIITKTEICGEIDLLPYQTIILKSVNKR